MYFPNKLAPRVSEGKMAEQEIKKFKIPIQYISQVYLINFYKYLDLHIRFAILNLLNLNEDLQSAKPFCVIKKFKMADSIRQSSKSDQFL